MSRRAFGLAFGILWMQNSSERRLAEAAVRLQTRASGRYLYRHVPKTGWTGRAEHSRAGCMTITLTLGKPAQAEHQPAGEFGVSQQYTVSRVGAKIGRKDIKASRAIH